MNVFEPARLPKNEAKRLAAVNRTGLMDSEEIKRFDIYTELFRKIADVPVSYTGLIDEDRQYFLSDNFSGPLTGVTEVEREATLCQHALLSPTPYIVEDLRVDPVFQAHPLVTGEPHWVFWAGFPIVTPEGLILGTLCAVDFVPRKLDESTVKLLRGVTAEMALSIDFQSEHQENNAKRFNDILNEMEKQGISDLPTIRSFLSFCMTETTTELQFETLKAAGLLTGSVANPKLSVIGANLKTGCGIGPVEFKTEVSPLKGSTTLDELLSMIED